MYEFKFALESQLVEAEMTLHLAIFAAEGLFGQARVRLDAAYRLDEKRTLLVVDSSTEVGAIVARIFTGLLLRERGEDGFEVRVLQRESPAETTQRAA